MNLTVKAYFLSNEGLVTQYFNVFIEDATEDKTVVSSAIAVCGGILTFADNDGVTHEISDVSDAEKVVLSEGRYDRIIWPLSAVNIQ